LASFVKIAITRKKKFKKEILDTILNYFLRVASRQYQITSYPEYEVYIFVMANIFENFIGKFLQ